MVAGGGENFEERGRAKEHLREDLREVEQRRDVSEKPKKIGVEENNLSSLFIKGAEARLAVELVSIGDAGRQIRR